MRCSARVAIVAYRGGESRAGGGMRAAARAPSGVARAEYAGANSPGRKPPDGAIIFDNLVGKLNVLHVACDKCGRKGRYAVARLIEQRGRDAKVLDLLAEITADCPKKQAGNMSDQCAAPRGKLGLRAWQLAP
jgi:hypothetical protein